jgi:NTP pyrophosphatase (non-canonical NTP hydrolase)
VGESSFLLPVGLAIRTFSEKRDWEQFHSPKNLAMALSVQASEVVEHFQWLTQEESRDLPIHKLAEVREEIGAVMIYLAASAPSSRRIGSPRGQTPRRSAERR